MSNATLIGIDLGKHCFFLHAQDARGAQVWRKKITRKQLYVCLASCPVAVIAMEACAGAHWLARKCQSYGHQVRLIAPQFVRLFVKGNKTDFADVEAICEAASRPAMRFVAVRTAEQQTLLALHRVRESLVAERTATSNQIHAFLLEFGIDLPVGALAITRLPVLLDDRVHALPPAIVSVLLRLHQRYAQLSREIAELETQIEQQTIDDEAGRRLLTIPGIGPTGCGCLLVRSCVRGQHRSRDPRYHSRSA